MVRKKVRVEQRGRQSKILYISNMLASMEPGQLKTQAKTLSILITGSKVADKLIV